MIPRRFLCSVYYNTRYKNAVFYVQHAEMRVYVTVLLVRVSVQYIVCQRIQAEGLTTIFDFWPNLKYDKSPFKAPVLRR
jgi:hypothetical protein